MVDTSAVDVGTDGGPNRRCKWQAIDSATTGRRQYGQRDFNKPWLTIDCAEQSLSSGIRVVRFLKINSGWKRSLGVRLRGSEVVRGQSEIKWTYI